MKTPPKHRPPTLMMIPPTTIDRNDAAAASAQLQKLFEVGLKFDHGPTSRVGGIRSRSNGPHRTGLANTPPDRCRCEFPPRTQCDRAALFREADSSPVALPHSITSPPHSDRIVLRNAFNSGQAFAETNRSLSLRIRFASRGFWYESRHLPDSKISLMREAGGLL